MAAEKSTFSFFGIGIGAVALMLALVHFWAGPFAAPPPLEQTVADKAVAIRDATIAALKGESVEAPQPVVVSYDLDRIASIATAVLGGLAVILAVVGYALKEPARVAGGAAALGVGAIAFQFLAMALGVLVLVLLIAGVLGSFGLE